jgi:GNAT superfamily N-acetyltransferase
VTYTASDDRSRVDRDWLWTMLSTQAYWGRTRTREQVEAQLDGAWRIIAVFDEAGAQVGYARAISDGIGDAYLADVIVDPDHRGGGIGKLIVRAMIEDGPGAHFRWTLFTRDAHGLYEQFGFGAPDQTAMVRPRR